MFFADSFVTEVTCPLNRYANSLKSKEFLIFLTFTFVLSLGQLTNCFKVVKQVQFENGLMRNGDGYIIGKLALSEHQGIFKNITAIAQLEPDLNNIGKKDLLEYRRSFFSVYSWKAYKEKAIPSNTTFFYYPSKTALHSFFYNLGNYLLEMEAESYIKFIKVQKSILFSLLLSLLTFWLVKITNYLTGVLVFLSLLFSPIINLISQTLYFSSYTFILPFVMCAVVCYKNQNNLLGIKPKHYILLSLSFFIYMSCHSFEFISTVGFCSVVPAMYYVFKISNFKDRFLFISKICIAYFVAIFLGVSLLLIQNSIVQKQSLKENIEFLWNKYKVRSAGKNITLEDIQTAATTDRAQFLTIHYEASKISTTGLVSLFLDHHAITIHTPKGIIGIKYLGYLILFSISLSLLLLFQLLNRHVWSEQKKLKNRQLIATSVFSILAPLSWLFVFKQHSYLHSHIIPYIFFLPFIPIGLAVTGAAIEHCYKFVKYNNSIN